MLSKGKSRVWRLWPRNSKALGQFLGETPARRFWKLASKRLHFHDGDLQTILIGSFALQPESTAPPSRPLSTIVHISMMLAPLAWVASAWRRIPSIDLATYKRGAGRELSNRIRAGCAETPQS